MYLGSRYYLFLCDLQLTKEALNRDDFASRPKETFAISQDYLSFLEADGQHWVDHRKLASRFLRNILQTTEFLQKAVMYYTTSVLERLEKAASQSKNGEVNLRNILTETLVSISCSMITGKTYSPDHEVIQMFLRYLRDMADEWKIVSLKTCLPWAEAVLSRIQPKKMHSLKIYKDVENYFWSEIKLHEEDIPDKPRDYTDYYLTERAKPNMNTRLTLPDLNGDAQIMMFGSADTTRAASEWFLLCMAMHPKVQQKAYLEICECTSVSETISYDQKSNTPYTEACILESMRVQTLAPLNPAHRTPKEKTTVLHGYDIPANTIVVAALASIHKDEQYWKHPNDFYPEHFLSDDGQSVKVPEAFIPFGSGKRICPGMKMANMQLFAIATSFLRRFQILPPEGGLNMEGKLRVNYEPVYPHLRLLRRNDR